MNNSLVSALTVLGSMSNPFPPSSGERRRVQKNTDEDKKSKKKRKQARKDRKRNRNRKKRG